MGRGLCGCVPKRKKYKTTQKKKRKDKSQVPLYLEETDHLNGRSSADEHSEFKKMKEEQSLLHNSQPSPTENVQTKTSRKSSSSSSSSSDKDVLTTEQCKEEAGDKIENPEIVSQTLETTSPNPEESEDLQKRVSLDEDVKNVNSGPISLTEVDVIMPATVTEQHPAQKYSRSSSHSSKVSVSSFELITKEEISMIVVESKTEEIKKDFDLNQKTKSYDDASDAGKDEVSSPDVVKTSSTSSDDEEKNVNKSEVKSTSIVGPCENMNEQNEVISISNPSETQVSSDFNSCQDQNENDKIALESRSRSSSSSSSDDDEKKSLDAEETNEIFYVQTDSNKISNENQLQFHESEDNQHRKSSSSSSSSLIESSSSSKTVVEAEDSKSSNEKKFDETESKDEDLSSPTIDCVNKNENIGQNTDDVKAASIPSLKCEFEEESPKEPPEEPVPKSLGQSTKTSSRNNSINSENSEVLNEMNGVCPERNGVEADKLTSKEASSGSSSSSESDENISQNGATKLKEEDHRNGKTSSSSTPNSTRRTLPNLVGKHREDITFWSGWRKMVKLVDLIKARLVSEKTVQELEKGIIQEKDLEEDLHKYLSGEEPVAGLLIMETGEKMSFYDASKSRLLRKGTAISLLEAQAATGSIISPYDGSKMSVEEAEKAGLIDKFLSSVLVRAERAACGFKSKLFDKPIPLFEAMKRNLVVESHGIRLLEAQIATGGIIDPLANHRLPVDVAYERGLFDERLNKILENPEDDTKGFFDPNTNQNLTYLQLMERCTVDEETTLRLLPLYKKKQKKDYWKS